MTTDGGASSRQGDPADGKGEETAEPGEPELLASTLVSYTDGPDRRTVYPPGHTCVERMSTWLTADADAFVDLEDAR